MIPYVKVPKDPAVSRSLLSYQDNNLGTAFLKRVYLFTNNHDSQTLVNAE